MGFSIGSNLSIPSLPTGPTAINQTAGPEGADSFGSMMRKAVDSVEQSQKSAEEEVARAVAGDSPDLHQTIIALQTADLHFQLGLQIRNKVVGAYEEIMRMQV